MFNISPQPCQGALVCRGKPDTDRASRSSRKDVPEGSCAAYDHRPGLVARATSTVLDGTVGYELFANQRQSQRATNTASQTSASQFTGWALCCRAHGGDRLPERGAVWRL